MYVEGLIEMAFFLNDLEMFIRVLCDELRIYELQNRYIHMPLLYACRERPCIHLW